jgi:pantoate--beta-alanine ligase
MKTIQKTVSFKEEIWNLKRNGRRIALVPTMGNIHDGHLDLVRQAKCSGEDITVISTIFVNPLQFGDSGSDFDTYPRTLVEDKRKLESVGCDLLFAPQSTHEIYETYPISTKVTVGYLGR